MQALHYAEASSYSILINRNFCDFTLWMSPALDVRRGHPFVSPIYHLHAPPHHQSVNRS